MLNLLRAGTLSNAPYMIATFLCDGKLIVEDVSAELTPAQLADVKDHMHASEVLAAAKPGKVSRDSLASVAGKAAHNRVNKATTKKAAKEQFQGEKRQKWKEESLMVGLFLMAGLEGRIWADARARRSGEEVRRPGLHPLALLQIDLQGEAAQRCV